MLGLAGLAPVAVAQGEAYPARPIKMIVPFPPGGTSDIMGRLIAAKLSEQLGQQVVVDNRGGANGNIGSNLVAKAEPDGYTLVLSGVGSHAINQSLYRSMPHHVVNDFTHIGMIAKGPNTLVVNPDFEAKNLKQLVDIARANPGKLSYASSASGSSNHLSMEMLKSAAGLEITHIPYKGGGPAITDVMAGHVPMMFINFDAALPYVQAGKLRALAMTGTERSPALPETPTVAESGYADFSAESWTGVSGPPKMPGPIVERLNTEIVKAVQAPDVKERLAKLGLTPVLYSPRQMADFVAAEVEKWGKAVKASGAQVD
jgi:tripartite-type tricarboxylate transporter receptor subunit TctC